MIDSNQVKICNLNKILQIKWPFKFKVIKVCKSTLSFNFWSVCEKWEELRSNEYVRDNGAL